MGETKGVASGSVEAVPELTHDAETEDLEAMTTPTGKRTTPAFQLYVKEFLSSSKVLRMSNTEVGVYIKLLCIAWLDNGLPIEIAKIAPMVNMPQKQFARIWPNVLAECFVEKHGRLVNPRQERQRKELADYRKQQKENAERRWHKDGNATALPSQSQVDALHLQSASATASEKSERRAPLVDRHHRNHAHCGRVCLPASLFSEFVRRRNHADADMEIRDWALAVDREWSEKPDEPGDAFDFWKARYAEKWPAVAKPSRLTAWRPEGVA